MPILLEKSDFFLLDKEVKLVGGGTLSMWPTPFSFLDKVVELVGGGSVINPKVLGHFLCKGLF